MADADFLDLLIHNAIVALPTGLAHGWVAVAGEKIYACGKGDAPLLLINAAKETVDAHGGYLIPGLIDSHVHFRTPGLTEKADIASESAAALAGGVTSVFDMPNTIPATTNAQTLFQKLKIFAKDSFTDFAAYPAIIPGASSGLLRELEYLRNMIPGVKLFLGTTTGGLAAPAREELNEVFRTCAEMGIIITVHAEDNAIISRNAEAAISRYGSKEAVPFIEHHKIRSEEACFRAAAQAVELAHKFGTRLHLAHVSTAREANELLMNGNCSNKLVTAETTPMYMDPQLADAANRNSLHKINPAIKTSFDAQEIRKAIADGRVDTIATDHAPHQLQAKKGGALVAASGAPSIQFALPIMMEYLPLELIIEKMATAPAKIFGIHDRGEIAPGMNADLALVRPCDPYIITNNDVISKCAWTPFEGRLARNKVDATWRRGKKVFDNLKISKIQADPIPFRLTTKG